MPAVREMNGWTQFFGSFSAFQMGLLGIALVILVGALDLVTGHEWSFSIFYLVPVALVSWYGRLSLGLLISGLSAAIWLWADYTGLPTYSSALIPFWNAFVRLGFFVITASLLANIRNHLHREQLLARTDGLTGLLNAAAFGETCGKLLQLARRYSHPTAIGFIDLDDFKQVNDTRGHAEGNRALQMVAQVLAQNVRASDAAARLGGDEFAVFLAQAHPDDARRTFQRLQTELRERAAEAGWPIGFSVGVALFEQAPENVEHALQTADRLMYQVKSAGKNAIVFQQALS